MFEGDDELDLAETTVIVTAARQLGPDWGVQLAGGMIIDGSLGDADVDPGVLLTAGGSYLALYEGEARPFVLVTATLGVSTTTATGERLTAIDGRLGVSVGKTFFDRATAYLTARAFGGPVFYTIAGEGVTGTDAHHYVVGAGIVVRPGGGVEIFAEGAPLGERSFTAGASVAF